MEKAKRNGGGNAMKFQSLNFLIYLFCFQFPVAKYRNIERFQHDVKFEFFASPNILK